MERFLTLFPRFCVGLAMALATVAALAVPDNAFADAPTFANCITACSPAISQAAYGSCIGLCCNTYDAGDGQCCSTYCNGDPDCLAACAIAPKKGCNPGGRGLARCTDGCYYEPRTGLCDITGGGTITGCVVGDNTCATCTCKLNAKDNTDCWCY
jgi:hypothetical protein